jgi:hypothetical protein
MKKPNLWFQWHPYVWGISAALSLEFFCGCVLFAHISAGPVGASFKWWLWPGKLTADPSAGVQRK